MEDLLGNGIVIYVLSAAIGLAFGWLFAKLMAKGRQGRQRRAWQEELEFRRNAADAAAREVRRLKSSLVEAESARDELTAALEASKQRLMRGERTIEKLVSEIKDLGERLEDLNKSQKRSRDELERKGRLLEDSRRKVLELEATRAMLTQNETELTAELANASSELGALQERFAQASSEKDKLDAAVHQIRAGQQPHALADALKAKAEELKATHRKLDSQRQTIARLRSELEQARRELLACRD